MYDRITPLVLTYNEAPNIVRTFDRLNWANRIVVIDSYSTDETIDILKKYPQVEIFQRKFDTHTDQWNYGLSQVSTDWVLSLDADYVLTSDLIEEIERIKFNASTNGYFIHFQYCVFGKPLKGTILPPRQMLFRKSCSRYIGDGHTQLLQIEGNSDNLKNFVYHDDRKPLSRWLWAQDRYMVIEAQKLLSTPLENLSWGDRARRTKILAPPLILFYCLILKRGIFDGWAGWYYAYQRVLAEILLALCLIEVERLRQSKLSSKS
jgi:glycosyltransferase involved in cell wall biosynthesis